MLQYGYCAFRTRAQLSRVADYDGVGLNYDPDPNPPPPPLLTPPTLPLTRCSDVVLKPRVHSCYAVIYISLQR